MTNDKKALLEKIELYLCVRKTSVGGNSPVETEEMIELKAIVAELISLKYEASPDDDLPVAAYLVDLTRFENPLVIPTLRANALNLGARTELELHVKACGDYAHLSSHYSNKSIIANRMLEELIPL